MWFRSDQELGIFFFCPVLEHVDLVLNTIALLGWHLLLPCYRKCGFSFKCKCAWELHNCTWELHNSLLSVCHLGFGVHNIAETWVTLGWGVHVCKWGGGERAGLGSQIKHTSEWLVHSKECLVSLASYWIHTPVFGCLHTWYWWPMLLAEYPTPSTESPNYWSDKDFVLILDFLWNFPSSPPPWIFPERDLVSVAGGMICFRVIFRFASFPKFPSTHYCQESTPQASSAAACPP